MALPLVYVRGLVETLFLVAIRNIQWDVDKTLLGSGCGIVSESKIEREWNELTLKRKAVKELLHLSERDLLG